MFGTDRDDSYTPRQPYQLGCAGAECVLVPPARRLAPLVHYYWTLSIATGRVALPVVPDNAVDLVLCPETPDYAELFFPVAEPFEIPIDGPAAYVGACLHLDRLEHAFGRDSNALRRLAPGLETLKALGLGALTGRFRDAATDTAAIAAMLDAFFGSALDAGSRDGDVASDRLGPSLFELFLDEPESERIADKARRAGSSERQFRRDVRRLFGLGPKKLQARRAPAARARRAHRRLAPADRLPRRGAPHP